MCGIFGLTIRNNTKYQKKTIVKLLENIALLSESRGKDSSGICFRNDFYKKYTILKATKPISGLLKEEIYKKLLNKNLKSYINGGSKSFVSFGHSRLVTNGTQLSETNNQPVIKDGVIAIHNGIIVNASDLWRENAEISRKYDIDTEVMLSLVRNFINEGDSSATAIEKTITLIKGTVSTAMFFDNSNEAILATNNGSIYYATNNKDFLIFASEGFILKELLRITKVENVTGKLKIEKLISNTGLILNIDNFRINNFRIGENKLIENLSDIVMKKYSIEKFSIDGENCDKSFVVDVDKFHLESDNLNKRKLLEFNIDRINNLKRCTKCLLPETFPFIKFDNKGVCNICNNYKLPSKPKSISELKRLVEPYRKNNGKLDCILPFSGGRDSSFAVHLVKKELGLNPITFTYDWGMVTDLARRNIARICGKLGVENVIVSANIKTKRENIRKNIMAWLKKPELGMIPLFMAGDKYFYYYTNQLKKQTGINLNIWGINNLENTDFKVGFCGIGLDFNKKRNYSLKLSNKIKLFGYTGRNYITNPAYINSSMADTFGSFFSRYLFPQKDYFHLFDYYKWDENEIENVLFNDYEWETANDSKSTWRIGDGTASFYNYIYYTVAGFSEFDTFRSNQIREGLITREHALKMVTLENAPRYESIRWYLDILGLDYQETIKKINRIPKLYL